MFTDDFPDDWRPGASDGPLTLGVGGKMFRITVSDDGGCAYDWVDGPNAGYGFSCSRPFVLRRSGSDTTAPAPQIPPVTIGRHREAIRDFLAEIDPETGYMTEST